MRMIRLRTSGYGAEEASDGTVTVIALKKICIEFIQKGLHLKMTPLSTDVTTVSTRYCRVRLLSLTCCYNKLA